MNNSFSVTFNNELSFINDKFDIEELKKSLSIEILNSQHRGLVKTTEWLTDILNSKGLDMCESVICNFNLSFVSHTLEYITSKVFYDKNEFLRCSHYLKNSLSKHPILDFLYFYSRFKAGLKSLYESEMDWMNSESQKYYDDLISLNEDILEFINNYPNHDAYILYLRGIILKKLHLINEAKSVLIEALNKNQYLWCAWYELSDITDHNDIALPKNWMKYFFEIKCLKLKNNKEQCDKEINVLIKNGFENVQDLKIDLATVNENTNNSIYSIEIFNEIYEKDPYRMDYFCTYSNILFVQENHKMLAELTQNCVKIDRYRYETCCVVGNFYSLRGKHEKAVIYFQRALKMNPTDSNTWLLTAHEYLELENFKAAVNCYCKAIYHNPNNHRAHYGLGQLYEMLKIHKFALLCYEKAFELLPNDSRILIGLGTVYEELGRNEEAKVCYYRAHAIGDVEHVALIKLGKLYEKIKDMLQAAAVFDLYIAEVQNGGFTALQNLSYAYMFLANYHWKHSMNYEKARSYAMKCCEIPDTKMVGEDMLRKIALTSKGDLAERDSQESFGNLESTIYFPIPSDDNLTTNAMNLSIGDDTVEINDQEMD